MCTRLTITGWVYVLGGIGLLGALFPLHAASKYTMPDLSQDENTCFPTAASNLIYWFGNNGHPQLIPAVAEGDDAHRKLIAQLLVDCNVSYKFGTQHNRMVSGLSRFFKGRGYTTTISYRGMGSHVPFDNPDWLSKNNQDNVGFILCIGYGIKKGERDYLIAESLGHCLTLVTYNDNVAVIVDPAHRPEERSRFTLRLIPKPNATLHDSRGNYQVPMLYELSGASVGYRPNEIAILTGAICIELPAPPPTQAVGQKR